jgi:hypothetical protein
MQKFKSTGIIIVSLGLLSLSFGLKKEIRKNNLPRYFRLNCSVLITVVNLENPSNWSEVSSPESDHVNNFINELVVYSNESSYIYTSGPKAGKPKVDIPSQFQTDLLQAAGTTSDIIEEIFNSEYEFFTTAERCN